MDITGVGASWAVLPLGLFPLLAELAVKGALVVVLAAVITWSLRRRSAANRHVVWGVAFACLGVLPLLAVALPNWRLVPNPLLSARPGITMQVKRATGGSRLGESAIMQATGLGAEGNSPHLIMSSPSWTLTRGLGAVWLSGILAIVLRYAVGTMGVRRWVRQARSLDDGAWVDAIASARAVVDTARPRVFETTAAGVPLVWGWREPLVFLPQSAVDWTTERRSVVLTHELAHVKRGDVPMEGLVQLVCALYWFHPAIWFAARRLRLERERACDDTVVRGGVQPSVYARHLLAVAGQAHRQAPPPIVALCIARGHDLHSRITTVLDGRTEHSAATGQFRRSTIAAAAIAVVLLGPLMLRRPMTTGAIPARSSLVFVQDSSGPTARLRFVGNEAEALRMIDSIRAARRDPN